MFDATRARAAPRAPEPTRFRAPNLGLSVTPATNAAAQPVSYDDDDDGDDGRLLTRRLSARQSVTHETFLTTLDDELKKMDTFAHREVVAVRAELRALEAVDADAAAADGGDFDGRVTACGETFLEVERYVNVNVTAVRKLLKKHDKVLPQRPIKAFYTARMHDMRWVRNDYSDVVVRLSRLYAATAARAAPPPSEAVDEQSFVRATTKYWVRSDDLSAVKLAISKHLPVLLQGGRGGAESKDSQLVNSVYLDSSTLELYHGRLNKLPGAVALRLRWYGTGEPRLVYVERKTHRDSWTGDESVKERFAIAPEHVAKLLDGTFDPSESATPLSAKELQLLDEVRRLISAKGLVPTVRSQCHRTAFQLSHTNAVRASIDTNLCLISEVQGEDPLEAAKEPRWCPAWKSTAGSGRPDQTLKCSRSVTSTSFRLILGRIDCSRRVLEARPKRSVRTVR